jgi:hypothetical protein
MTFVFDKRLIDGTFRVRNYFVQWLRSINDHMLLSCANEIQVCLALARSLFCGDLLLACLQNFSGSIQQDPQPGLRHQSSYESSCPQRSSEAIPFGVNEKVMIIAVADQVRALLLVKKSGVPLFPKPDDNLYEREKSPARRFAVRIIDNCDLLAAQLGNHARLQVAHLHPGLTPTQLAHQSIDDRAFAGPIRTKKDDSQFDALLDRKCPNALESFTPDLNLEALL